jgi:hypothetical protein
MVVELFPKKVENGKFMILEDGSLWEIDPLERQGLNWQKSHQLALSGLSLNQLQRLTANVIHGLSLRTSYPPQGSYS